MFYIMYEVFFGTQLLSFTLYLHIYAIVFCIGTLNVEGVKYHLLLTLY